MLFQGTFWICKEETNANNEGQHYNAPWHTKGLDALGNGWHEILGNRLDLLKQVIVHWNANEHSKTDIIQRVQGPIDQQRRKLNADEREDAEDPKGEQSYELESKSEGAQAAKRAKRAWSDWGD